MNDIDKIKQLLLSEQECNQRLGVELAKSQLGWGMNEIADVLLIIVINCFNEYPKQCLVSFDFCKICLSIDNDCSILYYENRYRTRIIDYHINAFSSTPCKYGLTTSDERNIEDENKLIEMFKTDLLIELNNIL
jgi:hypothetical protein